jgi:hypothetical protein
VKYLKTYKMILEDFNEHVAYQHEYDIFDFTNDLKMQRPFSEKALKMWTDYFIGEGYYDRIIKFVDDVFLVLDKIDIYSIEDRLIDFFDQYDHDSEVKEVILYGSYYDIDEDKRTLYSGVIYTKEKSFLIKQIILDIINPTLNLRETKDEVYVRDEKWQCSNINPKIASGYTSVRKKYLDKYSVDNFFDLYKPGIKITLGEEFAKSGDFLPMLEVQEKFEELMPLVIEEIEYSGLKLNEVIYPYGGNWLTKETRIGSYSIKILLDL